MQNLLLFNFNTTSSIVYTLKFYVASRRQDLWSRVSDVYKLNISINLAIHIYVTCYLNPSKFIPRSVISLKLIENSCRKHNNTVNCSHSRTCDNVELVSITSQKPCSTSPVVCQLSKILVCLIYVTDLCLLGAIILQLRWRQCAMLRQNQQQQQLC